MVAPELPTCGDRVYDCFVVSSPLAALSPKVEVLRPATTYPHVPVRISFDRLGSQAVVWVLQAPRPFDVKTVVDAQTREAAAAAASEVEWHAPLLDCDGRPNAAVREFFDTAEKHLVKRFRIEDSVAEKYSGRSKGSGESANA